MAQTIVTREIRATCEEVFDRLVDFGDDDEWMPRDGVNTIEATDSGCRITWTGNIVFGGPLIS